MIVEVLCWGLKPQMVTGDSWYSSRENLKFLRNQKLSFMMVIARNRQVAITPGKYTAVKNLEIPSERQVVYFKNFGQVKVFKK
jgi:urease beta subunit